MCHPVLRVPWAIFSVLTRAPNEARIILRDETEQEIITCLMKEICWKAWKMMLPKVVCLAHTSHSSDNVCVRANCSLATSTCPSSTSTWC